MVQAINLSLTYAHTSVCPVCELKEWQVLYRLKQFSVCCCTCGCKFIDPCLDDESQAKIYESSEALGEVTPVLDRYYEYLEGVRETRTEIDYLKVLTIIEDLVPKRSLLDAGCGSGTFMSYAQRRGWEVAGIDATDRNAQKVRDTFHIDVHVGAFEKYQSTGKTWSVITLWDLIEHPVQPLNLINKAYDLLSEDGVLVLATPNDSNLLCFIAHVIYRMTFGMVSFPLEQLYLLVHRSYFNPTSLSMLLKKGGFKVEKLLKTETDLDRYRFSWMWRIILSGFFCLARLVGLQNRMIVFARKQPSP